MTVYVNHAEKSKFDLYDFWSFSFRSFEPYDEEDEITELENAYTQLEHLVKARKCLEFERNRKTHKLSFYIKSDISSHVDRIFDETRLNIQITTYPYTKTQ